MAQQIKATIARSGATLFADMLGVAALIVILFAGLALPGLI